MFASHFSSKVNFENSTSQFRYPGRLSKTNTWRIRIPINRRRFRRIDGVTHRNRTSRRDSTYDFPRVSQDYRRDLFADTHRTFRGCEDSGVSEKFTHILKIRIAKALLQGFVTDRRVADGICSALRHHRLNPAAWLLVSDLSIHRCSLLTPRRRPILNSARQRTQGIQETVQ